MNLMVAILVISQIMMLQAVLRLYVRVKNLEHIQQQLKKLKIIK